MKETAVDFFWILFFLSFTGQTSISKSLFIIPFFLQISQKLLNIQESGVKDTFLIVYEFLTYEFYLEAFILL